MVFLENTRKWCHFISVLFSTSSLYFLEHGRPISISKHSWSLQIRVYVYSIRERACVCVDERLTLCVCQDAELHDEDSFLKFPAVQ